MQYMYVHIHTIYLLFLSLILKYTILFADLSRFKNYDILKKHSLEPQKVK